MRVIAKKALVDFYTLYPDAKLSLEDWYRKTIDAQWTCFADIKKSFNSVDAVGDNGNSPNCKRKDSNHICHLSLVTSHYSLVTNLDSFNTISHSQVHIHFLKSSILEFVATTEIPSKDKVSIT